jgi:ribosomal protein S18 acetylase RimI-like enzyme
MNRFTDEMKPEYMGLAQDFRVNPTSCNNPSHYEEYLKWTAITDNANGHSKTHVYIVEDGGVQKILGFITLRCTSVISSDEDDVPVGRAALEIYELAVHQDYERQGIGSALINIALRKSDEINTHYAGVEHIVLYADPSSVDFYLRQDFRRASDMYSIPTAIWNKNCVPMMMKLY